MRIGILVLLLALLVPLAACGAGPSVPVPDPAKLTLLAHTPGFDAYYVDPATVRVTGDQVAATLVILRDPNPAGIRFTLWRQIMIPSEGLYKTLSAIHYNAAGRELSAEPDDDGWYFPLASERPALEAVSRAMLQYCQDRGLPLDAAPPAYIAKGFAYAGVTAVEKIHLFYDPASTKVAGEVLSCDALFVSSEPQKYGFKYFQTSLYF
ncbi:MAG: hypothetical protein P4N41_16655, partial [Negativicutes bacterium]|nr:hypothetical protein [Negativicutes bacterium]